MKLKRIGILSSGSVLGIIYAFIGLFVGLIFAAIGGLVSSTTQADVSAIDFGFGAIGIVLIPLIYGVMGFVGGVISALLYNLVLQQNGQAE